MSEAVDWVASALVVVGVAVLTLGVLGFARMPDVYNQIHAAGKTVFLGLVTVLLATALTLDVSGAARALLTAAFIVVTAPVSAHAIARGAALAREPMEGGEVPAAGGDHPDHDGPAR